MTLPPSDAQSSRFLPHRPRGVPPTHSISSVPPHAQLPITPSPSATGFSDEVTHDRALDFASHSWDLATGGLKTLTAKREIPQFDRRASEAMPETAHTPRSYTFVLVILACLVLMLISGGVVLFVILQP